MHEKALPCVQDQLKATGFAKVPAETRGLVDAASCAALQQQRAFAREGVVCDGHSNTVESCGNDVRQLRLRRLRYVNAQCCNISRCLLSGAGRQQEPDRQHA